MSATLPIRPQRLLLINPPVAAAIVVTPSPGLPAATHAAAAVGGSGSRKGRACRLCS